MVRLIADILLGRKIWQEPCIVICPHWSLRLGPVTHLLRRWRGDQNSLLVMEVLLMINISLSGSYILHLFCSLLLIWLSSSNLVMIKIFLWRFTNCPCVSISYRKESMPVWLSYLSSQSRWKSSSVPFFLECSKWCSISLLKWECVFCPTLKLHK